MLRRVILHLYEDLDDVVTVWNGHYIRRNKQDHVAPGRPEILYSLPQAYGTRNYLLEVHRVKLEVCKGVSTDRSQYPCDPDLFELCCTIIQENHWRPPEDAMDATLLYMNLRDRLQQLLWTAHCTCQISSCYSFLTAYFQGKLPIQRTWLINVWRIWCLVKFALRVDTSLIFLQELAFPTYKRTFGCSALKTSVYSSVIRRTPSTHLSTRLASICLAINTSSGFSVLLVI